MFIDTREAAETEGRKEVRQGRRAGAKPVEAARARRNMAQMALFNGRRWRQDEQPENALRCFRIARGHLIIARMWDREAASQSKQG